MLIVHRPEDGDVRKIQRQDGSWLWSICFEVILRKHGFISTDTFNTLNKLPPEGSIRIVPRLTDADPGRLGLVEAPMAGRVADALGFGSSTTNTADEIRLFTQDGTLLAELRYQKVRTRPIPDAGDLPEPEPWRHDDRAWNPRPVPYARLDPAPGDRVALWIETPGGERLPGAVIRGGLIVFAFPALDLCAASHSAPPLNEAYYDASRLNTWKLERWICDRLIQLAEDAGTPIVRIRPWPAPFTSALTVRHDDDREIDDASLGALLDAYDRIGLRCSWGVLLESCRDSQARTIDGRGHEIALHATACSADVFEQEMAEVERRAGVRPRSYTTHGGRRSAGWLGSTQWQWADRLGMDAGECLGQLNMLPWAALGIRNRIPSVYSLMVPPVHQSLDSGTRPDAHRLDAVRETVKAILDDGGWAIPMNHPDIHRQELLDLLDSLDLSNVWTPTIAEGADWARLTRHQVAVCQQAEGLRISFKRILPRPARVDVFGFGEKRSIVCDAGACGLYVRN